MIDNFDAFGTVHILSLIIPICIGIIFILLSSKYPNKRKLINTLLVIVLLLIRGVRYGFDIYLGIFKLKDLFSLHICNINLYILIICLLFPNKKTFIFTYLIGIPTALAVALMPGSIHPDPGILRAIFFIMSHMMLVMGSIYLFVIYKFDIRKKDVLFYLLFSLILMGIIYLFNFLTNSNYLYLANAPAKTVLSTIYNFIGHTGYVISLYLLLVILSTILFSIYKISLNILNNKRITFS